MDKKTADKLNQLNKQFYLETQEYFNKSRQHFWQGWGKLLSYLPSSAGKLTVLDIGCGNGRWGKFLKQNLKKQKIIYTGVDNNNYLLGQAKKDLPKARLIKQDVFKKWKLGKQKFQLVTIMALLHHVPGFVNRLKLLKQAKSYLDKNGLLILSLWRFTKLRRLREKIIPWEKFKKQTKLDLNLKQLETNDYLMDWKKGKTAFRYNHLIDNQEADKLFAKLDMKLVTSFVADGKEGKGNRYLLLQKPKSGKSN